MTRKKHGASAETRPRSSPTAIAQLATQLYHELQPYWDGSATERDRLSKTAGYVLLRLAHRMQQLAITPRNEREQIIKLQHVLDTDVTPIVAEAIEDISAKRRQPRRTHTEDK